jgi:2-oxoisovalerate dehydrogenase E2 component (dihydrolipoyl transacylase)
MSEYVFKLPDLGEGTVESEIGEWFINVGDKVMEEDVVGTMMTDKAAIEVSSPVSGTVIELGGKPGDIIAVGAPLITFETENDVAATTAPAVEEASAMVRARRRQPDSASKPHPPFGAARKKPASTFGMCRRPVPADA